MQQYDEPLEERKLPPIYILLSSKPSLSASLPLSLSLSAILRVCVVSLSINRGQYGSLKKEETEQVSFYTKIPS